MVAKMLLLGVLAGVAVVSAASNDDGGKIMLTGSGASGASFNLRIGDIQSPRMPGWQGAKGSVFWNMPAYIVGVRADVFGPKIKGGSEVEFECIQRPSDPAHRSCQAYVFMYRCHPCQAADGGNLPARLVADGWERLPCHGQFSFKEDSNRHDFSIFRKEVSVGDKAVVHIADDLDYAFFALDKDSRTCSGQGTEAACQEPDFATHCSWHGPPAEECRPTTCVKPRPNLFHGPNAPRCSYCVSDDPYKL